MFKNKTLIELFRFSSINIEAILKNRTNHSFLYNSHSLSLKNLNYIFSLAPYKNDIEIVSKQLYCACLDFNRCR